MTVFPGGQAWPCRGLGCWAGLAEPRSAASASHQSYAREPCRHTQSAPCASIKKNALNCMGIPTVIEGIVLTKAYYALRSRALPSEPRKAVALLRAEQEEESQQPKEATHTADHPGPKSAGLPRKQKLLGIWEPTTRVPDVETDVSSRGRGCQCQSCLNHVSGSCSSRQFLGLHKTSGQLTPPAFQRAQYGFRKKYALKYIGIPNMIQSAFPS